MKKIISLLLIVSLLLFSAACGSSGAGNDAEKESAQTDGGWSAAESPAVTHDLMKLIDKACEKLSGASYTPIAYIGSQVVAGMNHAFLCLVSPVVPDAASTYAVVILYEDLDGNTEITDVFTSEAEAEVLQTEEGFVGGWVLPESPAVSENAASALEEAIKAGDGKQYTPVALLATQLVSGMNYSILCRTGDGGIPDSTAYAIVHVYQNLQGKAEITDTYTFSNAQ